MQLPVGRTIDVRDLTSLAPAFKKGESRCGVYRLHFANGEAYPGQSKNVVNRFASHRRKWPDVVAIDFFPVPADQLNEAEQFLITETERDYSVRNILLTNRPRGNDVTEIVTSNGSTVALPWERERSKGAAQSYADSIDQKLVTLLRHPVFPEIRSLVGWYIAQTLQDPAGTVGQLWTVTCLPSTNRTSTEHRLLTVSCGNLETLFIVASKSVDYANDPDAFVRVHLNTARFEDEEKLMDPQREEHQDPNDPDLIRAFARWHVYDVAYRGERVTSFEFGLDSLLGIIDGDIDFPHLDELLAQAFNLNTRLMRRGSTMYTRFHNEKLADLLLAEAVVWDD